MSDAMESVTENERRILALIAEEGPLSKGDLAARGHMGWATVVKYVNRLEAAGVLQKAGTAPRTNGLGKNSYLFDLSSAAPAFVGIDVEYSTTRVALVNLRREILWQTRLPTPQLGSDQELVDFLAGLVSGPVAGPTGHAEGASSVVGVGVGLPRWLLPHGKDIFAWIGSELASRCNLPVRVENNIRAYTLYKEPRLAENTFIVVSVRNGIGAGVVMDGILFRGEEGLAGEIGHVTVDEEGRRCRCGKRGCLETVVNQHTLCESYFSRVLGEKGSHGPEIEETLPELFNQAKDGNRAALDVLSQAAAPLGKVIAALLLVMDVRNLYLVGHFGEAGDVWLPMVEEVVRENLGPRQPFSLHYRKLENKGYLLGAALLVARDYLDYSVLAAASAPARR